MPVVADIGGGGQDEGGPNPPFTKLNCQNIKQIDKISVFGTPSLLGTTLVNLERQIHMS